MINNARLGACSATTEQFLSDYSPMLAGKMRKALENSQRYNGALKQRFQWVEEMATKELIFDDVKQRLHMCERGTFYLYADVTKTAIEYLKYLKR